MGVPCPHGDKLAALLQNDKLPGTDRPRVQKAIERYRTWVRALQSVNGELEQRVKGMTQLLSDYKFYVDVEFIFDSEADFLYRQKGQLKLDNSVIEEFLSTLVAACLPRYLDGRGLRVGPSNCLSAVRFESTILQRLPGGGLQIRSKDQDFAITRQLVIKASHNRDFSDAVVEETNLAYVVTECKTNLDKTMFQEAAATALDVKTLVPAAKYYLLCEWLDMTPINTATTAIDEVIILRRARRLASNVRQAYSSHEGRLRGRSFYVEYLEAHPFSHQSFLRFLEHVRVLVDADYLTEEKVLSRGHF